MTRRLALVLAVLLGGCSSDHAWLGSNGRPLAWLGVAVENEIGARSQIACEPLPFLHGSRRLTEHVIDGAFSITVDSAPGEARLGFAEGPRSLAEDLVVSRDALMDFYQGELTLTLASGESYLVSLDSECVQ